MTTNLGLPDPVAQSDTQSLAALTAEGWRHGTFKGFLGVKKVDNDLVLERISFKEFVRAKWDGLRGRYDRTDSTLVKGVALHMCAKDVGGAKDKQFKLLTRVGFNKENIKQEGGNVQQLFNLTERVNTTAVSLLINTAASLLIPSASVDPLEEFMIAHSKDLSPNHLYELAEWEQEGAQNEEKAKLFYEAAANKGHAGACYKLGLACQSKNKQEYVRWLTIAANKGHADACFDLAATYEEGEDAIPQDFEKAIHFYKKAIQAGNIDACFNLAEMYEEGKGVQENFKEAARLYERGADQDADCAYELATCYLGGKGVKQDSEKAIKFYTRAAEKKHPEACCVLA